MEQDTKFVGLDVHKATITVAVADAGGGDARALGTIPHQPESIARLVRKLGPAARLVCCYEAGPCGYGLQRQLTQLGATCTVVAPSLVPQRVGDRVKTDRRDAQKLARLLRSGELTPVWVPDEPHEALRDLSRARGDAREDLHRARQRLGKLLLRLGVFPPAGGRPWTKAHRRWLDALTLDQAAQQVVLGEYLLAVDQAQERLGRLDRELALAAQQGPHAALLGALQTLRGVGLITAVTLVAELGDVGRFRTARQLMAYVGVVPREASSGPRQRRGAITKTGNAHVRHVIVEAAWLYRYPPRVAGLLKQRQAGQPEAIKALSWKAQDRLHRRYRRLLGRGKNKGRVIVAVARELLGFVWALAQTVAAPEPAAPPVSAVA
jgi:transposase